MHRSNLRERAGFTLMELLVVIALIGILAALAILFVPSFMGSARAARGAGDLQGWLNGARQRAIRNQSPYGLRLLYNAVTGFYDRAQYIEQPDDLGGGRYFDSTAKPPTWLNLQLRASPDGKLDRVWVTNSTGKAAFDFGLNFSIDPVVQAGDYLEINGVNVPHCIIGTEKSDPKGTVYDMLVLAYSLSEGITTPVDHFRVMRRPRVVGDEVLEFPRGIVVDGTTNAYYAPTLTFVESLPPTNTNGDVDILFSPSGSVIPINGQSKAHILLWVRSTDEDTQYAVPTRYTLGEPTLIGIYVQSGLVAANPVNPGNPANPYDLVK